ncbi:MAG: DUF167 domain-containing protein [Candidatus Jorgensenbacteria bacterium]|nr:DUF167 domain-containing protein [Candidatus Jorgensenbacteria bacterium]
MKLFIKTKPSAKEEKVKKINEAHFEVWVREPAKEGKANGAVISVMAKYLKVSKSSIKIISGKTSKQKVVFLYNN